MEPPDHLTIQILRYQRLLENTALDSVALGRVRASLTELEEQRRLERVGTGSPYVALHVV